MYMDRSGIYRDRFVKIFQIRPANRPDAIGRKVDVILKKRPKKAYFSRFSDYLAPFLTRDRLEILNEGIR